MNPLIASSVGFGEALLLALEIFFLVIWVWIVITIVMDLVRDHSLSGWGKAAWFFFLIFVPFLSAFVYLIARGKGMTERAIKQQQQMQAQTDDYIRSVAGSPADELQKLSDLREKGVISQEDFDKAKAKVIS